MEVNKNIMNHAIVNVKDLHDVPSLNVYLSSTVYVAHAHGPRGIRWADEPASLEDMKRKVPQTMAESLSLIEHQYFQGAGFGIRKFLKTLRQKRITRTDTLGAGLIFHTLFLLYSLQIHWRRSRSRVPGWSCYV